MTEFSFNFGDKYLVALYRHSPIDTFLESTLQTIPLFWVWLTSLVVWFLIEISIWEAYSFNTKHSYVSQTKKHISFLLHLPAVVGPAKFRRNFLKIITKLYL